MVSSKQFYEASDQICGDKDGYVSCPGFRTTGILICIDGECAIVDDEFDGILRLPEFITSEKSARLYLQNMDVAFKAGKEEGADSLRKQLSGLLGLATREYVDISDARIQRQLEKQETDWDR